jgi:hypothetical protein
MNYLKDNPNVFFTKGFSPQQPSLSKRERFICSSRGGYILGHVKLPRIVLSPHAAECDHPFTSYIAASGFTKAFDEFFEQRPELII